MVLIVKLRWLGRPVTKQSFDLPMSSLREPDNMRANHNKMGTSKTESSFDAFQCRQQFNSEFNYPRSNVPLPLAVFHHGTSVTFIFTTTMIAYFQAKRTKSAVVMPFYSKWKDEAKWIAKIDNLTLHCEVLKPNGIAHHQERVLVVECSIDTIEHVDKGELFLFLKRGLKGNTIMSSW